MLSICAEYIKLTPQLRKEEHKKKKKKKIKNKIK